MKILILMLVYYVMFICANSFLFKHDRSRIIELVPFLLLLSFSLALTTIRFRILGSIASMHIHSTVVLLVMLAVYLFSRKINLKDPVAYFSVLMVVGVLLQVFVFRDILDWPNFTIVFGTYLSIMMIYLMTASLNKINLNQVLYNFNYLAILNGVLSILQYITGKTLLIGNLSQSIVYTEGVTNVKRVVGLAGSNNAAGNLGVLLFCICLYNTVTQKNLFSLFSLGITTVFSLLTLTRIGYLGMLVAFVIVFIGYENKNSRFSISKKKIIGGAAVFLAVLLIVFHKPIIQKLFIDRGNTSGERFKQYVNAWNTGVLHHPFTGVGIGQWQSYSYYNFGYVDLPIHSLYYNVLIENGLLLFIAFFALNVYLVFKVIRNTPNRNLKFFYLALSVSSFITVNFNPDQYYYVPNFIYFFVLLLGYRKTQLVSNRKTVVKGSKHHEK